MWFPDSSIVANFTKDLYGSVMEIRFCQNNQGSEIACKMLKRSFPALFIKAGACLKSCALCNSAPFAKIDDEVITAKSWRELTAKISLIVSSSNL